MSSASQHVQQYQQVDGNLNNASPMTPNKFIPLNALGIAAETTAWTPAAGKKFRLLGVVASYEGAAAPVIIRDNTAGTVIAVLPKNALDTPFNFPLPGDGVLSATANNVLTMTGVATQVLNGYIYGREE